MKKLLAICLSFLCVSPVMGQQYFGVDVGTSHAESTNSAKSPKLGAKAGVRYGYTFDNGFRTELHVVHRRNEFKNNYTLTTNNVKVKEDQHSLRSWSYMVNALYDISQLNINTLVPYVGAGIGYCQNTDSIKTKNLVGSQRVKEKDNRFAWQGIVGLKYAINSQLSTGLEYHYFCGKAHAKEHSFGVSVMRHF